MSTSIIIAFARSSHASTPFFDKAKSAAWINSSYRRYSIQTAATTIATIAAPKGDCRILSQQHGDGRPNKYHKGPDLRRRASSGRRRLPLNHYRPVGSSRITHAQSIPNRQREQRVSSPIPTDVREFILTRTASASSSPTTAARDLAFSPASLVVWAGPGGRTTATPSAARSSASA